MQVTAECVDEEFGDPVIDSEESLAEPVAHQRVSGHFAGSDVRFTIYLPSRDRWRGRFFQTVYPLASEIAPAGSVEFAADSGGYLVQTNSSAGYRGDAAAAKFSRTVAAEHYGTTDRIYGYLMGGSGGSFQTIAGMENSTGVWDGGVPFIVGDPSSIPNNFFIRALARLILRDKAAQIADAMAPGGSGDPFAGLDATESQVLREVTGLGLPLRAWEDSDYVLGLHLPDALLGFGAQIKQMDPAYGTDFWSLPGYLGTEQSPLGDRIRAARFDQRARVVEVENAPDVTRVTLDRVPPAGYDSLVDLSVIGDDGAPAEPMIGKVDPQSGTIELAGAQANPPTVGSEVMIDNGWYVALVSYPRHQVPARADFDPYDQYRNPDGSARYPQRALLAGDLISQSVSGGGTHSGDIHGKVIAVSTALDADAFPWHGDWYRRQVDRALGDRAGEDFRLWFIDNADHQSPGRSPRLIDYTGILHQALRDVAAWAESGTAPPDSTRYALQDGQLRLPDTAGDRLGIQPTVDLTANGRVVTEVRVGQQVRFDATVDLPPGSSTLDEVAWNVTGTGEFVPDTSIPTPADRQTRIEHVTDFDRPGTYFPVVKVTLRGAGDESGSAAGVNAIGRARVVVLP